VLVQGPYLVRGASLSGNTLAVTGDNINASTLEIFAPRAVTAVTWNGRAMAVTPTSYGSLVANSTGPSNANIVLPPLTTWKVADSLPERLVSYSDSGPAWVGEYSPSIRRSLECMPLTFSNMTQLRII